MYRIEWDIPERKVYRIKWDGGSSSHDDAASRCNQSVSGIKLVIGPMRKQQV